MKTALVTGANRGIGLELCRQLKDKGYEVYAVCRKPSDELKQITGHIIEGVDVAGEKGIERLKKNLKAEKLDVVINCAGIMERVSLDDLDFASMEKQFHVNALGPLRVVDAVKDKIPKGGKIVMITSRMGSIADNTSGGTYGYRVSKAALNMASVSLAHDLKGRGIAVGIVHPGYVKTDMTNHSGHIDPPESAAGILQRAEELNMNNTGTFWHQNGEELPW